MNRPDAPGFASLQGQLQLNTPLGAFLGAQRIALLEAIGRHGSIARAAKAVAMSYKAAWEAVDDMNHLAAEPLVLRVTGGPRGGGTTLTDYGQRLIGFFRALEQEQQLAVARLRQAMEGGWVDDEEGFRRLLKRFSMQSSARNQFLGRVLALRCDPVETQVTLAIAPGVELTAVVTTESVERMGLVRDAEVHALVKSSSVMLVRSGADDISARNRYPGRVLRLLRGPVNSEVTLQLVGAHLQLASVITDESVQRLGLAVGTEVTAFFKASSVLLAVAG